MFYYIKCDSGGAPIGHTAQLHPFEGYNTAADSARNGKPYYIPATYAPADPSSSQIKSGYIYDVAAGTITDNVIARSSEYILALIKQEAARRIAVLWGARDFDHVIVIEMNALMHAAKLNDKRINGLALTPEESNQRIALLTFATRTEEIRAASNALEARSDLPEIDVTEDQYWPVFV